MSRATSESTDLAVLKDFRSRWKIVGLVAIWGDDGRPVHISWKRVYSDVTSDMRQAEAPTFEQAIKLAISWEETNDKEEPEHA